METVTSAASQAVDKTSAAIDKIPAPSGSAKADIKVGWDIRAVAIAALAMTGMSLTGSWTAFLKTLIVEAVILVTALYMKRNGMHGIWIWGMAILALVASGVARA